MFDGFCKRHAVKDPGWLETFFLFVCFQSTKKVARHILPLQFVCSEWGGSSELRWTMAGSLSGAAAEEEKLPTQLIQVAAGKVVEHELAVDLEGSSLFYDFSLA